MPYKDTSPGWLFFADADLKSAKVLHKQKIYHMAAFHSQQTAEKSLKAFIYRQKQVIPKIHSLSKLFYKATKTNLQDVNPDDIAFLDQFYFPTRYPDTLPGSLPEGLPNKDDAKKAIAAAQRIFRAVSAKLNP